MAEVKYLHCRRCGTEVRSEWPYCFDCNIVLSYRAMPIILGMVFTGDLHAQMAASSYAGANEEEPVGYDDKSRLIWE